MNHNKKQKKITNSSWIQIKPSGFLKMGIKSSSFIHHHDRVIQKSQHYLTNSFPDFVRHPNLVEKRSRNESINFHSSSWLMNITTQHLHTTKFEDNFLS